MSEFGATVVRLGKIGKHPNADNLSITTVFDGYPCIIRTGDFQPGDLAIYISVDALVPTWVDRFKFLQPKAKASGLHRVRAAKIRGIFSMGLLIPAERGMEEHQRVDELLDIKKYEPPLEFTAGQSEHDPIGIPRYTDIEGMRKFGSKVFIPGEEVVVTEKVHGENYRLLYSQDRLWVGSHTQIKKPDPESKWWYWPLKEKIEERLKPYSGLMFCGELYGNVGHMRYGITQQGDRGFALFDILDMTAGKYWNWDDVKALSYVLNLQTVPILYRGLWKEELRDLASGNTTVPGADHIREGIVVKPTKERWDHRVGRVILKLIGEEYLLSKKG